tara:strand:+ start:7 stop:1209 length:1203 start_codon:yes stop_codon:yes gene_type:complete
MKKYLDILKNKKIALCITGSIAAYKSIQLASLWTQYGASVQVIMSESSKEFVGKASFEGITHNKVIDSFWNSDLKSNIDHLDIAKNSDIIVIAPATANIISKIVSGESDDVITTSVIATNKPLLIAPAMDGNMYNHFSVKSNIDQLRKNGAIILEPQEGYLASGDIGKGRLTDLDIITKNVISQLDQKKDLNDKNILISAGGTKEIIDSVRFIGNRSSGKMGHQVAEASLQRGGNVTLVTASNIITNKNIKKIQVESSGQMNNEIMNVIENQDCIIMAAAVSDFTPIHKAENKIKKEFIPDLTLKMKKTEDILKNIKKYNLIKVGFAAETENLIENGMNKLKSKNLDLIVINDVSDTRIGFDSDYNKVTIINKNGDMNTTEIEPKSIIANKILDHVSKLI